MKPSPNASGHTGALVGGRPLIGTAVDRLWSRPRTRRFSHCVSRGAIGRASSSDRDTAPDVSSGRLVTTDAGDIARRASRGTCLSVAPGQAANRVAKRLQPPRTHNHRGGASDAGEATETEQRVADAAVEPPVNGNGHRSLPTRFRAPVPAALIESLDDKGSVDRDLWSPGVASFALKNLIMRNGKPGPVRPLTVKGSSGARRASDVETGTGANGSVRAVTFGRDKILPIGRGFSGRSRSSARVTALVLDVFFPRTLPRQWSQAAGGALLADSLSMLTGGHRSASKKQETLVEVYKRALGEFGSTPLGEAAIRRVA